MDALTRSPSARSRDLRHSLAEFGLSRRQYARAVRLIRTDAPRVAE
ncbi:MAG: hypothetical protein QM779_11845 [Propionicimonas sp.]